MIIETSLSNSSRMGNLASNVMSFESAGHLRISRKYSILLEVELKALVGGAGQITVESGRATVEARLAVRPAWGQESKPRRVPAFDTYLFAAGSC
jgi:hypothetical protein